MKQSDTTFLTTVFPASEEFLSSFFVSLQNQTCKDFDVLVINDGISNFQTIKERYFDLNIIEVISLSSPAKNREVGIKKAIELGYKYIIFGDSDDYFSFNRIGETIKSLEKNDFVFNDLTLFSTKYKNKSFLSKSIKNIRLIQENILNSNVFGFSNIGIRSDIINPNINFDSNLIAVDWFFTSTLLIQKNYRIIFLDNVQTFYRQHSTNTVGMSLILTNQKLNLGLNVKLNHYSALIIFCQINNLYDKVQTFENKLMQIQQLKYKLQDTLFLKRYIEVVNYHLKDIFSGWWSEILTLEDFYKYENKIK